MVSAGSVASPKPLAACGRGSTIPFSCRIAWNSCNERGLILSWHCVVLGMPPWQFCFIHRGSRIAKTTGKECFGTVTWCHHMWICQGWGMDGTELLSSSVPSMAHLNQVFRINSWRKRGNGQTSVGRADWNDGKGREGSIYYYWGLYLPSIYSPYWGFQRKARLIYHFIILQHPISSIPNTQGLEFTSETLRSLWNSLA